MEKKDIIVYVGRWDLLPEEWEGINGLYEKSRDELREEVGRQMDIALDDDRDDRDYIGAYTLEEFEEEFNGSHSGWLTSDDYWIKFIVAGKPLDL